MKILLEVCKDLLDFALSGLFRKKINHESREFSVDKKNLEHIPKEEKLVIHNKLEQTHKETNFSPAPVGSFAFVCVEEALCFIRPVWAFDSAFMSLLYGQKVQVARYEGRFAQVSTGNNLMWILKDDITNEEADIFPTFTKDTVYLSNNPETKKLRKLTKDSFFTSVLELPLQSVEHVSYRLYERGRKIPWTNERPRLAGSWQRLLKGKVGVHVGVSPKTASIIEYGREDGTEHLGYIKEVHVNDSIVMQEVGREVEGRYTEELFTKIQWQEWRPVFIQVS